MTFKKIFLIFSVLCMFFIPVIAEENDSPWTFSLTTDFAYYPKSDYIAGGNHFAPMTGPYSGIEGRTTGSAKYTIDTPLGQHWLVSSANLELTGSFELSPVSIKPGFDISFTPLPFLVFSAGAEAGTGWNLIGLQGMAGFDGVAKGTYTDYSPFKTWYLKWYAQGTFQFDTGAIWEGDWTHVQILYTYQLYYEKLTSAAAQNVWMWQCTGNKVNGYKNCQTLILAYAMPLVVSRAGLLCEFEGYYKDSAFANPYYKGAFKTISISPMAQLSLGGKDVLTILIGFSSRRSFKEAHVESYEETALTYSGREWFFYRGALSWEHRF